MRQFLLTILVLIVFLSPVYNQTLNKSDLKNDIQVIIDSLPKLHPNLFFEISEQEFIDNFNSVKKAVDTLSDFEIVMKLQEATAKIGDQHTKILFGEYLTPYGSYPFEIRLFSDGLFIIGTNEKYKELLNCQILEVNGIKIEDVLEKISCIVPPNSRSYSLIWQESFLMLNGILEYYGITKNKTAKFLLKYPEGIIKEKQVDAESKQFLGGVNYYQDNQPYYWINFSTFGRPDNYFRDTLYVKDSIYFIQYNVCSSREVVMKYRSMNEEEAKQFPSFTEFNSRILKNLKSDKVNKVLFDLRFNSGGSSEQGTELISRIAEIPNINKKGNLFVAISWITFSSAVMNSMDFRLNTQAILIGKPTGSKPNHYGEVKTLTLPKTKLALNYSSKYFKYIDEDVDAVFPDIEVDSEFEDYFNAVDPMYEFVKNYK